MNRCIHHKLTLLVFMAVCAFSSALLASCSNGNKETIPVVGEFDSTAIAADTTMQLGFESSYEFHKTLAVHEKLVYDVVGYGGSASKGEFAVLKRGADNKPDTIGKEIRLGKIADAFIAENKINVVVQSTTDSSQKQTFSFPITNDSGK